MAEMMADLLGGENPPEGGLSEEEAAHRQAALAGLAEVLAGLRREAIDGRYRSGIEVEWEQDEEFYEGIDDTNRHEVGAFRSKPSNNVDPSARRRPQDQGSTIFPNITRPYCDAAAARVGDMLLPTDDRGWKIKPTPIPELGDIARAHIGDDELDEIRSTAREQEGLTEEQVEAEVQAEADRRTRSRFPRHIRKQVESEAQAEYGNVVDFNDRLNKTYRDLAEQTADDVERAKKAAEKAEQRIDDWHVEGQYQAEMRKVIDHTARVGTGVLKGPVPELTRQTAYKEGRIIIQEVLKPVSRQVSHWNCFPDPGCGESIHNGAYHWERDDITYRRLAELRAQPGYLIDEINAALTEGPHEAAREIKQGDPRAGLSGLTERRDRSSLFEIWYGYCDLTRDQLEQAGIDVPEEMGEHPVIPVQVTMVNNHVILVEANHLDTGEFPYDYMVWQRRANSPWGIGVARQIRVPQRIVTAASRNMMDNAGLAGGPMWVYARGIMRPLDGKYELRPRKGWEADGEALKADPRLLEYAIRYIEMPMRQAELQAIIEFGLKMAEDVTGLPMLMQGHVGSAPDTASGMVLLNNNSSTVLRRVARLFDDLITEPHVRRYYRYLLQWGDDDEEKGDFTIDARGSSALVERELNKQAIGAIIQFSGNPVYKLDPAKTMEQYLRAQHLEVDNFTFDDEKWEETVRALAEQAKKQDSSVEIAHIRAQAQVEVQQLRNQNSDLDRQLKAAELAIEDERHNHAEAVEQAFKVLEQELEREHMEHDRVVNLDEWRGRLSETAMKLRAQFQMQAQNDAAAQLTEPPVEPTGRAPEGQAYQR